MTIKLPQIENKYDKMELKVTFFEINSTKINTYVFSIVKFIGKNVTFNPILSNLFSIRGNFIASCVNFLDFFLSNLLPVLSFLFSICQFYWHFCI